MKTIEEKLEYIKLNHNKYYEYNIYIDQFVEFVFENKQLLIKSEDTPSLNITNQVLNNKVINPTVIELWYKKLLQLNFEKQLKDVINS